jgi:hypothetical protein
MALNGFSAGRAARPLSGEDRTRRPISGAAVHDPKRTRQGNLKQKAPDGTGLWFHQKVFYGACAGPICGARTGLAIP